MNFDHDGWVILDNDNWMILDNDNWVMVVISSLSQLKIYRLKAKLATMYNNIHIRIKGIISPPT